MVVVVERHREWSRIPRVYLYQKSNFSPTPILCPSSRYWFALCCSTSSMYQASSEYVRIHFFGNGRLSKSSPKKMKWILWMCVCTKRWTSCWFYPEHNWNVWRWFPRGSSAFRLLSEDLPIAMCVHSIWLKKSYTTRLPSAAQNAEGINEVDLPAHWWCCARLHS